MNRIILKSIQGQAKLDFKVNLALISNKVAGLRKYQNLSDFAFNEFLK